MNDAALRSVHRPSLLLAAALGTLAAIAWVWPPSRWLAAAAPDGTLLPETAAFVDRLPPLALAGATLLAVLASWARARHAAAGAWSAPFPAPSVETPREGAVAPLVVLAVLAFGIRLALGALGDPGLGDDGARVHWVRTWLAAPHFVTSGLWAPGHLYVHALFARLLGDAVWGGIVLSALAAAGLVLAIGWQTQRDWGRRAGLLAAALVGTLPVGLAYGSVPDVNVLFACCIAVAVVALSEAARGDRGVAVWMAVAWLAFAWASWMRFETFLLIPGLAVLLLPRWRRALGFLVLAMLPVLLWQFLVYRSSGDALHVVHTVHDDPSLAQSRVRGLFGLFGGVWLGVTVPLVVLGALGVERARRQRHGRLWLGVGLLHAAALVAAVLTAGGGYQPRYWVLVGAILAGYAAVAIDGVWTRQRAAGAGVLVATALALAWLPGMHPEREALWMRQDVRLRHVVDCVAARIDDGHVVWIADEAAFFFEVRTGWPADRYHAMSRADTDPAPIQAALQGSETAWMCLRDTPEAERRMHRFLDARPVWDLEPVARCEDYRVLRLRRSEDRHAQPDS